MEYFTTQGRLNRLKYFLYILPPSILGGIGIQMMDSGNPEAFGVGFFMSIFAGIFILFPAVRRLHDINASGWWYILSIVPIANIIMGLVLLFVKGTEGKNRFGSDPLQPNEAQEENVSARQDTEERKSPARAEEKAQPSSTREFNPDEHDKKCPMCAEYIKLEARVCRYCGHEFSDKEVENAVEKGRRQFLGRSLSDEVGEKYCHLCGEATEENHAQSPYWTCEDCADEVPVS